MIKIKQPGRFSLGELVTNDATGKDTAFDKSLNCLLSEGYRVAYMEEV